MLCAHCIALIAAVLATPALADPAPASRGAPTAVEGEAQGAVLTEEEMRQISGGQEVLVETVTSQTLTGSSSGNSITAQSYASGAVTFSAEALDGFNGIGNFVINTGANNTLQGAINVSVVTVPAP